MNKPYYRAKSRQTGEWVYGTLLYWNGEPNIATVTDLNIHALTAIDPETLSQATGYTDEENTDIYEGDIIVYTQGDHPYRDGQEVTMLNIPNIAADSSEMYDREEKIPYQRVVTNRFDTPDWKSLYTEAGRKQALREQWKEQVDRVIAQSRKDNRLVHLNKWIQFQNCQHEVGSKKLFRAELADLFIDIYSAGYAESANTTRTEEIRHAYREGYNDCKNGKNDRYELKLDLHIPSLANKQSNNE